MQNDQSLKKSIKKLENKNKELRKEISTTHHNYSILLEENEALQFRIREATKKLQELGETELVDVLFG